jgi:hypothetical protein
MADQEDEGFIQRRTRTLRLALDVKGGRVFTHNADVENIDRCTIELKCTWSPSFLTLSDTSILIGNQQHKPLKWDEDGLQVIDKEAESVTGWSLIDCPILLSLSPVDESWLNKRSAEGEDQPLIGSFRYHAPIQTSDGVVNETRPLITAWFGVGIENFKLIRSRLFDTDSYDFDIGLDVEFPRGTVERGWTKTKVEWDGKDALPIARAVVVWKLGDWDSKADRVREISRKPEPSDDIPSREHLILLQSINRLEAAIVKLATPTWLVAAAAVVGAILLI